MNDILRRAILAKGLTEEDVAKELGVDPKTVRRWISGRLPFPRLRLALSRLVDVDEDDLWPELQVARAARSRPDEVKAVYPHRWSVTRDGWRNLFASADREIGILAYSGLFLAEDAEILSILADKARAGVNVRICLGDPDSPHVAERGTEEGIGDAMAAKIRNALTLYRPLLDVDGIQLRLHRTVLYNSLYLADDDLLVNQHAYGIPAAHAPVFHLRRAISVTCPRPTARASSASGHTLVYRLKTEHDTLALRRLWLPYGHAYMYPVRTSFRAPSLRNSSCLVANRPVA